jgi:hypothetical protein
MFFSSCVKVSITKPLVLLPEFCHFGNAREPNRLTASQLHIEINCVTGMEVNKLDRNMRSQMVDNCAELF